MGKNRTINTKIWEDDKIYQKFTPEDKMFWFYLLTNDKTNNLGCYEIDIRKAMYDTGFNEDSILNLLSRFSEYHKVIIYDYKTKEVLIRNYSKYNWTASPTYKKGLENDMNNIKSADLKYNMVAIMQDYYGKELAAQQKSNNEVKVVKKDVSPNNEIIKEVINYYNNKSGARLTTRNKSINSLINARIKEGATLDDFKNVLDYKYDDWFNDDTMAAYYRPNTLFTSKFHDYLSAYQMGVPVGNNKKSKTGKDQRIRKQDDALWEALGS